MSKKRYVQVGVGSRAEMYYQALAKEFREAGDLVGLCDNNTGRLRMREAELRQLGLAVRTYKAEDFEKMLKETKAECVIVTPKDCLHDEYVCRAMELGCDVITEKPMTTDERKCQRIVDTQRRTGRKCTVTFNCRYAPPTTQVKDLLMSGVIGDVLSGDFQEFLDTSHGADYFRRWHRHKGNSGGLLVHKATHHFDMINWWLSALPVSVFATGQRKFYTPQTAARYGFHKRSERCLDCAEAARCPFYLDLRKYDGLRTLYLENEVHDGYFRDRCVFSQDMDIEDAVGAVIRYDTGAIMTYSLNAFLPYEGQRIAFNGTKGRLEHTCGQTVYISGDGTVPGELILEGTTTKIFPDFQNPYTVPVWTGEGGHGGGDTLLLEDIFTPGARADKYKRAADQRSGAYSILIGVAANRSIASGQPVRIDNLVKNIGQPDYPAMPSPDEPLPLVQKAASAAAG